jgi:uncharacterized protein YigE (DUF2233 family)
MFLSTFVLLVPSLACSNENESADEIRDGLTRSEREFQSARYETVRADLQFVACTFHLKDESGTAYQTIDALVESHSDAEFITNGGIFEPDLMPAGLYIEDGTTLVPLNTKEGDGNFYLKPNGIFIVDGKTATVIDTSEYEPSAFPPDYAVQSGPLLLKNGEIHPAFNPESENRYIRSGVGVDGDGQLVFALSKDPVTFHEFATFFRDELECPNALYLDGAISKFWFRDTESLAQPTAYASMIALSPR